ncbi:MAG: C45 family autoproteolytic acyltransferase/hydrolase [Candidatus Hodarchaeota archaeon]
MFEQKISGSYYEMGLQIGEKLKQVRIEIKKYPNGIFLPIFSSEKLELAMKFDEKVRKYTPDLHEEMKGISDGSGFAYKALVANEFTPYRNQPSCLVMAISGEHTQNGLPVLARNHEWIEEDSVFLTLCYTRPKNKIESFGFTFAGLNLSRFGGINEAGLAIASASADFFNSGPGVMFNVAIRWILDNCRTTEEGVAFIEKIPKTWGTAYILIDSNNTIAKVEAHREKTKITYAEDGFGFVTLRFDSPEMVLHTRNDEYSCRNTNFYFPRAKFLTNWFERYKGQITNNLIIDALKDHDHYMCNHSSAGKFNYGICWSYLLSIGEKNALVCAGPPCKNEFRKINIK